MNRSLAYHHTEPIYFYRVTQFVHRPSYVQSAISKPFYRDFSGGDLFSCRARAYEFLLDRMSELEMSDNFLMDGDPQLYAIGKEVQVSHVISLVEYYDEEDYTCYPLNSENIPVRRESMAKEYEVLSPLSVVA
jgi:hypothetical protein